MCDPSRDRGERTTLASWFLFLFLTLEKKEESNRLGVSESVSLEGVHMCDPFASSNPTVQIRPTLFARFSPSTAMCALALPTSCWPPCPAALVRPPRGPRDRVPCCRRIGPFAFLSTHRTPVARKGSGARGTSTGRTGTYTPAELYESRLSCLYLYSVMKYKQAKRGRLICTLSGAFFILKTSKRAVGTKKNGNDQG